VVLALPELVEYPVVLGEDFDDVGPGAGQLVVDLG
jgi:hypothetical protein